MGEQREQRRPPARVRSPQSLHGTWLPVAAVLIIVGFCVGCSGDATANARPDPENVQVLIHDIENRTWD